MEQFFQVGIISSTHGIRGEVKVFPTTDDVKRFKKNTEVLLETGKDVRIPLKITQVKFFKQFVILKFEGFDSINDIEKYKGRSLYVSRENAVSLNRDEYFIADLIGMKVFDEENAFIGELKEVYETGANDVYIISRDGGEDLLIPAIKQCILDVDVKEGVMKVHLLEGL